MKKKSKKPSKGLAKSVRKALKRHSIATGVLTGAATVMALSTTGATRRVSEAVGSGMAGLLKANSIRGEMLRDLKQRTGDALVRAGRSLQSETTARANSNAKVTSTKRRSAAARAAA
jgi:hypothetical protein